MTTASNGLNNNGDNILAVIGVAIFAVLSILFHSRVDTIVNGILAVPVLVGAALLFTNKEYPIQSGKLIGAVALFIVPLIVLLIQISNKAV